MISSRTADLLLPIAGIAAALVAWEITGRILGDSLFAPFTVVLREYVSQLADGEMLRELAQSMRQMLVGFGLAYIAGLPLGVLMGRSRLADAALQPWVGMLIVTSVAALVPLFILLFGTGFTFRAAVVFMASVWYIVVTVYQGARGIDPRFVDVANSFGAGRSLTFMAVLMPALFPYLITAARIGIIHAIRAMVVAEMFVIVGYGALIHKSGLDISTAPLLGLLVSLMLVSMMISAALRAFGRWLAPWYEQRTAAA
jgi:ABC-type nitrate/sulfonate/bicarbonate transport system permease component